MQVKSVLVGFVFGVVTAVSVFAADVPEVKPVFTSVPPKMDGKLTPGEWDNAAHVTFMQTSSGQPAHAKTDAYLMYDKERLYVGFRCEEPFMDKLHLGATFENADVYDDDCVQLMIAPYQSATSYNYFHFAINALGAGYWCNYLDRPRRPDFQCAGDRQDKSWTAEFSVALKDLKDPLRDMEYWRINLMRMRLPQHELTSWATTPGYFHSPWCFGRLSGIDIDGEFIGRSKPVTPVHRDAGSVKPVMDLKTAIAPYEMPLDIIPKPVAMKLTPWNMNINSGTKIVLPDYPSYGEKKAAQVINEELTERGSGLTLPILTLSELSGAPLQNCIIFAERSRGDKWISLGYSGDSAPGPEGYTLSVKSSLAVVLGTDGPGIFYGAQSLRQLVAQEEKVWKLKGAQVWDQPGFKVRSCHILLDRDSPTVHKKMIRDIFARYKYNQLVMEAEHGVAWKSHPEIVKPYAMKPDEVRELVAYANDNFIEVVPLINHPGHGEWMFSTKDSTGRSVRTNLEFCEDASQYPYAYCALDSRSYDFIFSIYDEVIDYFNHPKTIHIGHDEYTFNGKYANHPWCKAVSNQALYYADTMITYNYLSTRGIKTMIWGDIFRREGYEKYLKALPKDIMIADWHYTYENEQPTNEMYMKLGFPVIGGTWYRPDNYNRFANYSHRIGCLGMMQTTWAGYDKNSTIVQRAPEQVAGYIGAADIWWNPVNRDVWNLSYNPDNLLRKIWFGQDSTPRTQSGFVLNLAPYANLPVTGSGLPGFELTKMVDQQGIRHVLQGLDGVFYHISEVIGAPSAILLQGPDIMKQFPREISAIPVNRKAKTLHFLQGALIGVSSSTSVLKYKVQYIDKSVVVFEATGRDCPAWNELSTYYKGGLSWAGTNDYDKPVYLSQFIWVNPNPDKVISNLSVQVVSPDAAPFLFAVTGTMY